MIGIASFKEYFKGFEDQYVIIGGTACEIFMQQIKNVKWQVGNLW